MTHEEDGHCSDGKEQHGYPEADFIDHLADQHPALHFLRTRVKKRNDSSIICDILNIIII